MFTGIVEELGSVVAVEQEDDAVRLRIRGPLVTSDAVHGASIAVNGVCLTVVEHADGEFVADVMQETLDRSSLGALVEGAPVNLERPVTLEARLGRRHRAAGRRCAAAHPWPARDERRRPRSIDRGQRRVPDRRGVRRRRVHR